MQSVNDATVQAAQGLGASISRAKVLGPQHLILLSHPRVCSRARVQSSEEENLKADGQSQTSSAVTQCAGITLCLESQPLWQSLCEDLKPSQLMGFAPEHQRAGR